MARCNPHDWDVKKWLPIYGGDITTPHMTCLSCGRVLRVIEDITPNMQASLTVSLASRLEDGDEYVEVRNSVTEYFNYHLERFRQGRPTISKVVKPGVGVFNRR